MTHYDIAFIGHMCFDEIVRYGGETTVSPGSAVLCGAMAAARVGKKVTVITKMNPADDAILDPMRQAGIDTFVIPARETSYMKVIHPSANVDERQMIHMKNAGFFELGEMPEISAEYVHLAGICDREFSMEFMRGMKAKGVRLSADMQDFVRQVDPETREVFFRDVPAKKEIAALMGKLKLDIVEAKLVTGTDDLEAAAKQVEFWGCPEVVITQAEGVLARASGVTYYEKFSNSSTVGRTGRGDTTFAAYLARRMDHASRDSLKFAAALVSIKMETPGPFAGTLQDVLTRMAEKHQ
jgi:sugar/nucleoside kinase (ribokinase family)